jgi:hypothetical protein
VDQKTGPPVRITQWGVGGVRTVWEMSDLRIDAALPAQEFASAIPAGGLRMAASLAGREADARFAVNELRRDLTAAPPAPSLSRFPKCAAASALRRLRRRVW